MPCKLTGESARQQHMLGKDAMSLRFTFAGEVPRALKDSLKQV